MTTNTPLSFLIRDGLEADIEACLAIDHSYETDHVWRMSIQQEETQQWNITFMVERLPRTMEVPYPPDEPRMRASLPANQCFLVATRRDNSEVLGYLVMRHDPIHRIGFVHELIVARPYRRQTIGARLLGVAHQWAKEQGLTRLMIELQTKNYPAILFCQELNFAFCGFNDRYFPNQDIAVFFSQSVR